MGVFYQILAKVSLYELETSFAGKTFLIYGQNINKSTFRNKVGIMGAPYFRNFGRLKFGRMGVDHICVGWLIKIQPIQPFFSFLFITPNTYIVAIAVIYVGNGEVDLSMPWRGFEPMTVQHAQQLLLNLFPPNSQNSQPSAWSSQRWPCVLRRAALDKKKSRGTGDRSPPPHLLMSVWG